MQSYDSIYINGEWVRPLIRQDRTLINPATEKPFATVAMAGAEDVERAVSAARTALASYSRTAKEERIALLEKIIELFNAREGVLAETVMRELGTPISQKIHVPAALASFRQAVATLKDYE